MSDLRYPPQTLRGDYIRTGIGLILTIGPALALPPWSPALLVLLPATVLFLIFGYRTWRRQVSRIVVAPDGISLFCPRQVSLTWTQIRSVRLSYFSTRSDHTGGWMQLTLKGEDPRRGGGLGVIRVDSALDNFDLVARQAAAAAHANGLALSAATQANFEALGIDLLAAGAPPTARREADWQQ